MRGSTVMKIPGRLRTHPHTTHPKAEKKPRQHIASALQSITHPERTKNQKLLNKVGIHNPSQALLANKILMKVLKKELHGEDSGELNTRAELIKEAVQNSSKVTTEEKLLDVLQARHIVTDSNYSTIFSEVQKGDVIAFFTYENPSKTDTAIRIGQRVIKPFVKGATSDSHNATHIMIVVDVDPKTKRIKIAEATPDNKRKHEVRILDFKHESFRLHKGEFSEYRVYRNNSEALAKRAAEVANYFAEEKVVVSESGDEKGYFVSPTTHGYSKKKAVKSILGPARFSTKEAKDAALQAEAFLTKKSCQTEKTKAASRKFFCADFVGFSFLTAEISIRKDEQAKKKEAENAENWEKGLAWQVRASRMSPQKFVASLDLLGFQQQLCIIPDV